MWLTLKTHRNSLGDNKNKPGRSQEHEQALNDNEQFWENNYLKDIKEN